MASIAFVSKCPLFGHSKHPVAMFGWPGASQAGDGFCWSGAAWATETPAPRPLPVPADQPGPANADWPSAQPACQTIQGLPPPAQPAAPPLPLSRSGAAALAAQRAQQTEPARVSDPWAFASPPPACTAAPVQQPAAGATGCGWRKRNSAFLQGDSCAAPGSRQQPAFQPAARLAWQAHPAPVQAAAPQAAARAAVAAHLQAPAQPIDHKAAPAAPQAKLTLPAAPPAAPPGPAPLPASSLSLERYLDFWQLLTKGTGRVQPLTELEKSIVKAADLKQASVRQCVLSSLHPPAASSGCGKEGIWMADKQEVAI